MRFSEFIEYIGSATSHAIILYRRNWFRFWCISATIILAMMIPQGLIRAYEIINPPAVSSFNAPSYLFGIFIRSYLANTVFSCLTSSLILAFVFSGIVKQINGENLATSDQSISHRLLHTFLALLPLYLLYPLTNGYEMVPFFAMMYSVELSNEHTFATIILLYLVLIIFLYKHLPKRISLLPLIWFETLKISERTAKAKTIVRDIGSFKLLLLFALCILLSYGINFIRFPGNDAQIFGTMFFINAGLNLLVHGFWSSIICCFIAGLYFNHYESEKPNSSLAKVFE